MRHKFPLFKRASLYAERNLSPSILMDGNITC